MLKETRALCCGDLAPRTHTRTHLHVALRAREDARIGAQPEERTHAHAAGPHPRVSSCFLYRRERHSEQRTITSGQPAAGSGQQPAGSEQQQPSSEQRTAGNGEQASRQPCSVSLPEPQPRRLCRSRRPPKLPPSTPLFAATRFVATPFARTVRRPSSLPHHAPPRTPPLISTRGLLAGADLLPCPRSGEAQHKAARGYPCVPYSPPHHRGQLVRRGARGRPRVQLRRE